MLASLPAVSNHESATHLRDVAQLEISTFLFVLQLQRVEMPINPVSVLVNDRPRPPSRQEVVQMQYLRYAQRGHDILGQEEAWTKGGGSVTLMNGWWTAREWRSRVILRSGHLALLRKFRHSASVVFTPQRRGESVGFFGRANTQ